MGGQDIQNRLRVITAMLSVVSLLIALIVFAFLVVQFNPEILIAQREEVVAEVVEQKEEIIDGIHVLTGLKDGEGLQVVIQNCTSCHSAKLITQNRMSYDSWQTTIRWMQQTQNLWDLGPNEEKILKYLSENYAPTKKGRRSPLTDIEWYALDK